MDTLTGRRSLLAALVGCAVLLFGAAAQAACPTFYVDGQAPATVNEAKATAGREFCRSFYAVSYSTARRDPIWSAERLTKDMAVGGDQIGRIKKTFGRQEGLSSAEQGAHADYTGSPWDRGHMTPANDAPDEATEADTFVVSNIVPQSKQLNERLWQYLEASVHQLAELQGEVYIVTGPVFGDAPALLNGRIAIPSATYKAIHVPTSGLTVAFVATNTTTPVCMVVAVTDVIQLTGVDPFPSLPAATKAARPEVSLPHGINIVQGRPQEVPLPACAP